MRSHDEKQGLAQVLSDIPVHKYNNTLVDNTLVYYQSCTKIII